jgi:hypothetical protein
MNPPVLSSIALSPTLSSPQSANAIDGKQSSTSDMSRWLFVGAGDIGIILIATAIGLAVCCSPSRSREMSSGSSFSSQQKFRIDGSSAELMGILTFGIGIDADIQTNGTRCDMQMQMNLADDSGKSLPGIGSLLHDFL